MSTRYDLWMMYGFPITAMTLKIPTSPGETAPTLREWFDETKKKIITKDGDSVCLEYFGWMNGSRAVPFIGVDVASENNIGEAEVPGTSLGKEPGSWLKPPTRQIPIIEMYRKRLGCTENVGFYLMLRAG